MFELTRHERLLIAASTFLGALLGNQLNGSISAMMLWGLVGSMLATAYILIKHGHL